MDEILKWLIGAFSGGAIYKILDVLIKGYRDNKNDDAANRLKARESEWKQREAELDRWKQEKEAELTRYKVDKEAHLKRVDSELERVNAEHADDRKNLTLLHDRLLAAELSRGELRSENAALKLELTSLRSQGIQS